MKSNRQAAEVLYLCSGRNFKSSELNRKLEGVASCWRRAGHNVAHVCGGDIAISSSVPNTYGSQETFTRWYRGLPGTGCLVTSLSEWRDIRHDRDVLRYLEDTFWRSRPDIVWERSCRLHSAGLTFARRIGVPYVLEWKDHLIDYSCSFFRKRAIRAEEQKNSEANFVVVESEVLREALVREGVEGHKIIVAHNAVDAHQFDRVTTKRDKVRRELGIDSDTVLVGYLGSYAFYHDTARLVLAADIIQKESHNDRRRIRILMVGAGKEYQASRRLAEKLGLLDTILQMQPGVSKNEVPAILSALDIAVLPGSTDIICPIKIQEYMACQLPILAPDYACNREVLQDGRAGVLFTPKDEKDLADKLLRLASDRSQCERFGRQARKDVIRRFNWSSTWGAALVTVLDSVRGI